MHKKLTPEERKAQIIQTALRLFAVKGYENTTVNNIIEETGISKGGFYHHYSSKEGLLEDIAQLFVGEVLAIMREISGRDDLSALEKTNEYIRQVNSLKKEKWVEVSAFLSEMYSGGKNMSLENKIFGHSQALVAPIMKSVIEQGIAEGEFKTNYPEEAAEVYVRLFLIHQREMAEAFTRALGEKSKDKFEDALKTMKRKYMFLQETIESVLGLEKGSLVFGEVVDDLIENVGRRMFDNSSQ